MKPKCKLVNTDGNVFSLSSKVHCVLRRAGQNDKSEEFSKRLLACKNYSEALALMAEYVEIH